MNARQLIDSIVEELSPGFETDMTSAAEIRDGKLLSQGSTTLNYVFPNRMQAAAFRKDLANPKYVGTPIPTQLIGPDGRVVQVKEP